MNFIVVGTNHKYSPIEAREKMAFSKKRMGEVLSNLVRGDNVKSAVIISTCNRVEIYAHVDDIEGGIKRLKEFFSAEACLYAYIGKEAIRHLASVASGLDSQIIGERQIIEQVKSAHSRAKALEATDRFLDAIFEQAIETALKVRRETGLSKGDISIATIAIDLIKERLGSIDDKRILVIGVGKISELMASRLKEEGTRTIFVSNRTYERARELAKAACGEAVRFERLKEKLKEVDVIISSTASPHVVLKKEDILEAFSLQPSAFSLKRLLIIDLAVPRDVDDKVREIMGIELYSLDDLDFIIKKKSAERLNGAPKAMELIEEDIGKLCSRQNLESERELALLR